MTGPALAIEGLAFDAETASLSWSDAVVAAPYTVVVLGPDYREMARSAGVAEATWVADADLQERLVAGETYHLLVLGGEERHTRKSQLLGVTWR
ncbi:MAG: hypothetical protein H6835_14905 [Planctomycetes bacterium]|nr:hypothetical protein [Planctomycetota bacterium]